MRRTYAVDILNFVENRHDSLTMSKEAACGTEDFVAEIEPTPEKRVGCAHYKRRAKFVVSIFIL